MYVDTSVLTKLYVTEPDSEACEATVQNEPLVSSRLLYCEFRSALMGKVSRKTISEEGRATAWQHFENDVASRLIQFVPLNDQLVDQAADLLSELHPQVPLRTLDALHLATYLSIESGPLFTKDQRMRQAARRLGLTLAH